MADFEKVNDVAAGDIEKVNDIAKSSIQNINGVDTPSATATVTTMVAGCDDGLISYVPIADVATKATWQNNKYDAFSTGAAFQEIAAGKDGSGNTMYVGILNSSNPEILFDDDSDITDGDTWGSINLGGSGQPAGNHRQRSVAWGNNVWVTIGMFSGSSKKLYRSTDGTNWSAIGLESLTDIAAAHTAIADVGDNQGVYGLTTNGTGDWWFGYANKLYKSTDNASSWSLHHTFTGQSNAYHIKDLAYTNNSLIALFHLTTSSDAVYVASAANSDTTDWSTEVACVGNGSGQTAVTISSYHYNNLAAAGGRVLVNDTGGTLAFDVNGKTIAKPAGTDGNYKTKAGSGNLNYVIGDGAGNWYTAQDGSGSNGHICRSTDNGMTWTKIVDGFSGSLKAECICHNVPLPL